MELEDEKLSLEVSFNVITLYIRYQKVKDVGHPEQLLGYDQPRTDKCAIDQWSK